MRLSTRILRASAPFVDKVKVLLCSGQGGDGACIFMSLPNNEFAGPGGGHGGKGGDIFVSGSNEVMDLTHIEAMGTTIVAGQGSVGLNEKMGGRNGTSVNIMLPLGTQIVDVDTNDVVVDLNQLGMKVLLLEGGHGGKGNSAFANSFQPSPLESTNGIPGNTMLAQFELKALADCGLVGYPNAGKSSILAAVTTSCPEISHYPFTTLRPYIGQIHDIYGNCCSLADIPGLIEGAYENRGLGQEFLRHIERSTILTYVVDMYSPCTVDDKILDKPWDVLEILKQELEFYSPGLSERAILVFANKMDQKFDVGGNPMEEKLRILKEKTSLPVYPVSAMKGIMLGSNSAASGLVEPVSAICQAVFAAKKSAIKGNKCEEELLEDELDDIFKSKYRAHFTPVNFGSWRTKVQGMKNGLASTHFIHDSTRPLTVEEQLAMKHKEKVEIEEKQGEQVHEDDGLYSLPGSSSLDFHTVRLEQMSLVDQQLDSVTGATGYNEPFDAYKNLPYRANMMALRDKSLGGHYWKRTRDRGERLPDEKWT